MSSMMSSPEDGDHLADVGVANDDMPELDAEMFEDSTMDSESEGDSWTGSESSQDMEIDGACCRTAFRQRRRRLSLTIAEMVLGIPPEVDTPIYDPPDMSRLVFELLKCKQVFSGSFVLPYCSAYVRGHLVGGNIKNPELFLPMPELNLETCKHAPLVKVPATGEKKGFAIIVFVSSYANCEMMDASWAELRHLMFSMKPTPCGVRLIGNSWGQFLRPGDSGIDLISQFAPRLFEELEHMPHMLMVLFRKCRTTPRVRQK